MTQPDVVLGLKMLGEIQALRHELEQLDTRAQARAVKARVVALHEQSVRDPISDDVGVVVDRFFNEAKATITRVWGTSAWDDAETVEEAKARMGTLPAAPGSEPPLTGSLYVLSFEEGKPARYTCRVCGEHFNGPPAIVERRGDQTTYTITAPPCPRADEHRDGKA